MDDVSRMLINNLIERGLTYSIIDSIVQDAHMNDGWRARWKMSRTFSCLGLEDRVKHLQICDKCRPIVQLAINAMQKISDVY